VDDDVYVSDVLSTSYEGALNVPDQLMLGTLLLEETAHAVTPDQAQTLLPLWQALQAGSVTADAEVGAILKQIEQTMSPEQLQAIAAMQLTQDDLRAWMEEQGMGRGFPRAGGGTLEGPSGTVSPEMATRQAEFANMTDEERESAVATMQAGGDMPGGPGGVGGPGRGEMPPEMATRQAEMENMTDEEREAFRATMQAGGGMPGGPGGNGGGWSGGVGGRQANFLLRPLIDLLETRAGE
jgi:hypothetical protein